MRRASDAARALDPERWRAVKSLFQQALEQPREERARWLESSDSELDVREEVLELLAHHEASGAVLESSPRVALDAFEPLDRLGSYRIVRVLGRGGMGVVYLAEQDNPRRTVALKVIHPLSLSPQAVRRFEHEAQLLARLSHPGIAQIFEAGTDGEGDRARPFFAMELVEGVSLTEFARSRNLSVLERVELFAAVCDAVQHAHQKGVIHRDLKPSNILVDAAGRPKVLDFGVARATDEGDASMRTAAGQLVGTLHYMSPEQVAGDPRDLDTRSDVYALGVVLYELLAGRLPHELEGRSVPEAVRIVAEHDGRPLGEHNPMLRGDLETIAAKALERDRSRRYASASDLASDLRRFLRDEPVAARPASTAYQLAKFARRNRVLVAGAAATFAALVLGVAGTSWQAVRATDQRDRALELEGTANAARASADVARADAEREAITAKAVSDLLVGVLASPDPGVDGRDVKVFDRLKKAVAEVDAGSAGSPRIEAAVRFAIARTYNGLGMLPEAQEQARLALEINLREIGADEGNAMAAKSLLATIVGMRGDYARSESLAREAEAWFREHLGDDSDETRAALTTWSCALFGLGRFEEAEPKLAAALERLRRVPGEPPQGMYFVMNNLAMCRHFAGDETRAEELLDEALGLCRSHSPRSPAMVLLLQNLADTHDRAKRPERAQSLLVEAVALDRTLFPDGHPGAATRLANLAITEIRLGQLEAAETHVREAIDEHRRLLPADHPSIASSLNVLTGVLLNQRRWSDAEVPGREALAITRLRSEPHSGEMEQCVTNLANALENIGGDERTAEALELFRELVEIRAARYSPGDWHISFARAHVAHCLGALHRWEEAEREFLAAHEELAQVLPSGARHLEYVRTDLANFYTAWGKPEQAEVWRAMLAEGGTVSGR